MYAATPVYHDVVKYDSANQTLDYEYNAGAGPGTAAIQKIKFGNIVLDSSIGASPSITVGSYFSIDGSNGSISAADGKFTVSGAGAITASSLKLTGTNKVDDVGKAINDNKTNIATNKTNIDSLDGKIDTVNTNIRSDMANEVSTINTKIDTKLDTSTFGAYTASNNAAVNELKNKTQKIKYASDTVVTSSDATYIDGITHAGGVRLADKKVRAEELVLEEKFANGTSAEARLTREGIVTLNGLTNGSSKIEAGNGSVVGGVTFDNKNITNVESVMVNKDANNQVQINSEGIVVGLNSTVIGSDGVYAGGHTEATAKAVLGADGSIKGAGDGTGNYKFKVTNAGDVFSSSVTATLGGFNDVLINNGLAVGSAGGPNVAIGGGGIIATNGTDTVTVGNGAIVATGDITANGALSGASLATTGDITGANITASGALNGDSLNVNNDAAIGGKLDVTGNIQGADITATGALKGGSLNVTNDAAVGGNLAVAKNIKGQSLNIGATDDEFTVDTVGHMTSKSAQIGSVGINNTGVITGVTSLTTDALHVTGAFTTGGNLSVTGDLEVSGAIKGKTISISDGGSIAGVSFATGGNLTATTGTIAGVSFATGGNVSGINNLTATGTIQGATLKVNDKNLLDSNGLKAEKAVIDSVVIDDASITSTGANGLDVEKVNLKNGAITADKATIGGVNTLDNTGINVATGSKIQVGVNTVIEDGSIAVSTNTKLTDQALNLNATNKWTAAGGLEADKASINGVTIGETAGKAVFNKAGKSTTIDGDAIETGKITADELLIDKISLGKGGSSNITIDKDGHVQTKGDIKITDAAGNVMSKLSQDQATFGKDAANQTNINNGKLKAKAKNTANQQAEFNFDENGLTVSGQNAAGATSSFGFNASTGIGTFTGQDGTTTAINGSSITSTNGGATGVLNGSSLTLDDGTNSTALNAGGATFTGAAGEKGGKVTTINGGTITTDTLNVERINLGGELYDKNGTAIGGNLSMDKDGNFSAAGGNFKVKGGTGTDRGALHNKVGNTYFDTTETGASMKFDTTTPTGGGVKSEVSVADNSAKISAGASSIEVKSDGITNTGKTTFTGATGRSDATDPTVIKNQTTIDGGIITTDTLNVQRIELGDKLVDKNGTAFGSNLSMDNQGNFSAAGGNFKVNGADGAMTNTVGNATFETKADSIGGVVTNGTVKMRQELTADGVKVSVDGDTANYTQITNKDVSITDQKNPGKRINLSDLGQLNNLDGELTAHSKYTSNETAVGAINAEAAIRREEVARLDNRIDDVNNRVDKVGAMAAAIASLKSIGYDPQAPSEFSIGLGQYKGETGVAMGFFHYPNKNFMINVSLSTAGGETMGGIGATWRFGHKSPQKLLEEQREAQARKELAAAEKYQAAAKLAKEAQERAEYAAKLARQAQVSADNAKAAADATQAKHFQ